MKTIKELKIDLNKSSNEEYSKKVKRFFKTKKGEYAENNIFIGIKVPEIRRLSSKYENLSSKEILELLKSKIHEYQFAGLVILIKQFNEASKNKDKKSIEKIIKFYLTNAKRVNNWDLVDISAPNILGKHILHNASKNKLLFELAKSKNLWERRISIVSTLPLVRSGELKTALKLCEIHLFDKEDLMNKAVGWVLREIGKQDKKVLIDFLEKYHSLMPRISLSYSLEKFSKKEKEKFMKK